MRSSTLAVLAASISRSTRMLETLYVPVSSRVLEQRCSNFEQAEILLSAFTISHSSLHSNLPDAGSPDWNRFRWYILVDQS